MGNKDEHQQNQQQLESGNGGAHGGRRSCCCCPGCSMAMSRIDFSFRCVFVVILSLALVLSGIFWIFPFQTHNSNGFDAKEAIKLSATVQACFKIPKPVSEVVPHINSLEDDIFNEISIDDMKVAMLSMHQNGTSNWTDGVFGVLSDHMNTPLNPAHLSVLRSSLVDLFLKQMNLSVATSVFGQPYDFEILKFPGGVTVIPLQYGSIWTPRQPLFNFTLNNSISEILHNFGELRDQLRSGLRLRPYENLFLQITNSVGSTINTPVILEASVSSEFGSILPQRLKQLAQAIADSDSKNNLGLHNSVFGKVKGVVLSSYLNRTLNPNTPTPAPAPSPKPSDYVAGPSALINPPAVSPAPSPHKHARKGPKRKRAPSHFFPPVNSPAPTPTAHPPPDPCPYHGRKVIPPSRSPSPSNEQNFFHPDAPLPKLPPAPAPLPAVSYGPTPSEDLESPSLAPVPSAHSGSSFAGQRRSVEEVWLLGLWCLLISYLLCWHH
ncbi:unnamed protein product [Linum tenue]|uniref:DUF7036 domain-containing protein n=1 Tax=Linum tenue TaxID=586396 RepID=A0AAV0GTR7_9ROSI|nr:unnamed protein product [Linum tenue]